MPDRFYLTTSIAYANNRPGLHTLYEVIGADALARWSRMRGIPTRFLTGTDEHSVNIAMRAAEDGRSPRDFVDEQVGLFRAAEDALLISPDRFIRTTDPDHVRSAQEMVRRAYAKGDIYVGIYEGWYCPNEGFRNATDVQETAAGTICPNHPEIPLQWLTERNWFFRLSAYQERLERWFEEHPRFVQPDHRRNEMLGFIRGGLEDFSISRAGAGWGIPFPLLPDGSDARRADGTWDPDAGTIYVWYDALINYITGAGFPDEPAMFARWWPADLHVIGKDIARFHTLFWPAILWSAGLEAPRRVWVHGWLLAQGERMSKSRGNFLDPIDFVAAFGADGARYIVLREVAFDRDTDVSWDAFLRRYNADLANDFGNLVNRTVSMGARYLGSERPPPRDAVASPLGEGWSETLRVVVEKLDGCLIHEALAALWELVGRANRSVEAEAPWALAKAARAGDADAAAPAPGSARRPRRDLPPGGPRGGSRDARRRPPGAGPAWLRVPVRRQRQRRPAAARRAGLGRTRRRGGHAGRPRAALPAPRGGCRRRGGGASLGLVARMRLVDSHAHLQSPQFADDVAEVLAAAEVGGVERVLVPGWNEASSVRALELVNRFPRLVAAAGIHPHDAARTDADGWERTAALAADANVVAIGETGLDYDRRFSPIEDQLLNLRRNLALALATGKPAILHCRSAAGQRDAQDALLAALREAGFGGPAAEAIFGDRPPALLHSVSGPPDYVAAAVELGCAVSVSGLCFRTGEEATAASVRLVPADRLLVETDAPYLSPPGAPRRRNEPAWVRITAAWVAEQRGEHPDALGERLVENFDRIFGLAAG